jgi:hypothetical protein
MIGITVSAGVAGRFVTRVTTGTAVGASVAGRLVTRVTSGLAVSASVATNFLAMKTSTIIGLMLAIFAQERAENAGKTRKKRTSTTAVNVCVAEKKSTTLKL